jgi:hypothetical protein
MKKKAKKTPKQLEREIQRLILQRFGKDTRYLLMGVRSEDGAADFMTNDANLMFSYGAILLGRFCELTLDAGKEDEQKSK